MPVIEVLVGPGDQVAAEDPLITLESDKATMDVPSPQAGTVRELRIAVGDTVSEGALILVLEGEPQRRRPRRGRPRPRRRRPSRRPAPMPTTRPRSSCSAPAPAATPRPSAPPTSG